VRITEVLEVQTVRALQAYAQAPHLSPPPPGVPQQPLQDAPLTGAYTVKTENKLLGFQ
jgi:hypothetical protein